MNRWLVAMLVVAGCVAGCKDAPTEAQCGQLLDHLIDLEFKNAGAVDTSEAMKAEIAKQKQTVASAKSTVFHDVCVNKTARARVECALAAKDLEAVGRCDDPK